MKAIIAILIKGISGNRTLIVLLLLTGGQLVSAQSDKKYLREGNRDYHDNKFNESELAYRRAAELPKSTPDSWFSLGNAVYKQERYDDAASTFEKNASMYEDNFKKANSFYNLGNAFLGAQKLEESINAYKNSLRLNPDNLQAKYNLSYAQDLLQKQQQEQQDDQNKDQNKEDDNKDKENQDKEGDKEKEQEQGDENKPDEQQKSDKNESGSQNISQEDARRLLEALSADEKKVQDKVLKEKAAASKVRTLKNW
jgi:Ca-activated chloride channel homolog